MRWIGSWPPSKRRGTSAGRAIDLFLGWQQREHEDIEIAVPQPVFREVADPLAGFELFAAGVPSSGFVTPLELAGERETHQTWAREPTTGRRSTATGWWRTSRRWAGSPT